MFNTLLLEDLFFQQSLPGGFAGFGTSWRNLPLNGSGQHIIDQTAWTVLLNNIANWPVNVSAGGHSLANADALYFRRLLDARTAAPIFQTSTGYNFAPIPMPNFPLAAGVPAVVTIPVPYGVNGNDISHYLWISGGGNGLGGQGVNEAVLITGGSAISGSAIGTLIFTPANTHTGPYTLSSATAGIQEAICDVKTVGSSIIVPSGIYPLNANVSWSGKSNVILTVNPGTVFTGTGSLPANATGNLVYFYAQGPIQFTSNDGSITGTIDGVNAVFNLSYPIRSAAVFLNGLRLTTGLDCTVSGTTITFITNIPSPGDVITAEA